MGGLGRWFPVGEGGTTQLDLYPSQPLPRGHTSSMHASAAATRTPVRTHTHTNTGNRQAASGSQTMPYPHPSHAAYTANSLHGIAGNSNTAAHQFDSAHGGARRLPLPSLGGFGGRSSLWGKPYGTQSVSESQEKGEGGGSERASGWATTIGGRGGAGRGTRVGWGGDRGNSSQENEKKKYDFSSGHWGDMRKASHLLLN